MPFITVFTPTYNRAYCLNKCYESLLRQTNKDFVWLIIDDGSTDDTQKLVHKWIEQTREFEIRYTYKENGGLHTGYNAAIEQLDTELAICVDSDDYLVDDAIERIADFWQENNDGKVAGIVALDATEDKKVIGDLLPEQSTVNLIDLTIGRYKLQNGDRKLVVRTDLYKSVAPQMTFLGEKNFNPHYMHLQISQSHDFLVMNQILCIVEYLPGGMTNSMLHQYYSSPNSFAQIRRLYLSFNNAGIVFRFKQCIHYVSSSILAHDRSFLKTSPAKALTVLAVPLGWLLSLVIRIRVKHK